MTLEEIEQRIVHDWTPEECLAWAKENDVMARTMLDPQSQEVKDHSWERVVAYLAWELAYRRACEAKGVAHLPVEKKTTEEVPFPFESLEFRMAWMAWLQDRKERKLKKYTTRGLKGQFKRLAKMGEQRAIAAIEYSIDQQWQGIFEERCPPKNTGNAKLEHMAKTLGKASQAIAQKTLELFEPNG